ncbi:outer membrane beta-barrel protein [Pedobacter punctiformis]|uniref:Outer membrane protein beta-barrel domain-containing protein n=1 Tax=Pedobacter punctiformis TaxID=3004097 RepID=A0ABT4L995_9SPHI|nr:outer membrane beta-barrel protein [Pedobacter sp. HCMS5-2]MCZ4244497.1 hypothetical protein [Pedobacter sp. HCMS5-2]
MKKLLITLLTASVVTLSAKAQISKGDVMIGANLSNIDFALDKPNAFSFTINPKAAWFIQDGLALGGDVSFGIETPGKGLGTTINYGIGALGRYYGAKGANELANHTRFFGEATVGISGRNLSGGGSTNGLGFSFGPGFTYFVTRNVGLETLLKYEGVVGFGSSAYAHNLNLGVGFQIYLPGKATAKKVQKDFN